MHIELRATVQARPYGLKQVSTIRTIAQARTERKLHQAVDEAHRDAVAVYRAEELLSAISNTMVHRILVPIFLLNKCSRLAYAPPFCGDKTHCAVTDTDARVRCCLYDLSAMRLRLLSAGAHPAENTEWVKDPGVQQFVVLTLIACSSVPDMWFHAILLLSEPKRYYHIKHRSGFL